MKEQILQREAVTLSKNQYRVLFKMYLDCKDEYTKFDVEKYFNADERKHAQALVGKHMAYYSDNTNKIQISLNGFNSIANPPGLSKKEQNEICWEFSPPSKKKKFNMEVADASTISKIPSRSTYASKPKSGESKKDMVARFLKKGQSPQEIFESMAKEGVQTTVGSVRCFIKTINDETHRKN